MSLAVLSVNEHGDVDFNLQVGDRGYWCVYDSEVRLYLREFPFDETYDSYVKAQANAGDAMMELVDERAMLAKTDAHTLPLEDWLTHQIRYRAYFSRLAANSRSEEDAALHERLEAEITHLTVALKAVELNAHWMELDTEEELLEPILTPDDNDGVASQPD